MESFDRFPVIRNKLHRRAPRDRRGNFNILRPDSWKTVASFDIRSKSFILRCDEEEARKRWSVRGLRITEASHELAACVNRVTPLYHTRIIDRLPRKSDHFFSSFFLVFSNSVRLIIISRFSIIIVIIIFLQLSRTIISIINRFLLRFYPVSSFNFLLVERKKIVSNNLWNSNEIKKKRKKKSSSSKASDNFFQLFDWLDYGNQPLRWLFVSPVFYRELIYNRGRQNKDPMVVVERSYRMDKQQPVFLSFSFLLKARVFNSPFPREWTFARLISHLTWTGGQKLISFHWMFPGRDARDTFNAYCSLLSASRQSLFIVIT